MSYQVKIVSGKKGMDDFLAVPSEIYKDDPNRIVTLHSGLRRVLDPLVNPYFKRASLRIYVCYKDERPVSRSVLVINRYYWQKWNKKSAFFGFFETANDRTAVRCLLDKIEADSRESGALSLEGPFNPNHYSELGILTDNFDTPPVFFETHNPPYYPGLLEENGFTGMNSFHTMINRSLRSTLEKNFRSYETSPERHEISVRKFNIFRFRRDLEILRAVNNDAFDNNQFFLPLSESEYKFSAKNLFFVTSPGHILIAEYRGRPVGAVQFALNINVLLKRFNGKIMPWNIPALLWKRSRIDELVVFTVGVRREFRKTWVFAMLLRSSIKILRNYSTLSTTWISDDNLSRGLTRLLELKTDKHFTIYSKQL
jgi:hypothetical protein